jgi:alkylation response protein AidB-like acyl-CoA dehydrogenase
MGMEEFFQAGPSLGNPFAADPLLQAFLRWRLPADLQETLAPGLLAFGGRVADEVQRLGQEAEAHPPRHVPFGPWGERIDQIEVSGAWKRLQDIAAREGLVSIGYQRAEGPYSRLHQFARLYLFHPDSAWFTCPLAMTDGAARAIEEYGDDMLKDRALSHLLSRDPAEFWTAGQWMTERTGGSDVSRTGTTARKQGGAYLLSGTKWFTSATTSPVALTLARIEGAAAGSAGLSLFYVELFDAEGRLRNIRINRLKDKLGSRALPTAELVLEGATATLVGDKSHGVRKMSSLFNLTRLHNSVYAVAYMRRALAMAKDYASRRMASGRPLLELPAHVETLARTQVEWEGCFHLTFHLAMLLGRAETGGAGEGEGALLRLLTPVAKLYTAKRAVSVVAEAMEAFGGAGYVEDTGMPVLMRDTLVLPIWEGTTNVLALDVLRAMERDGAFEPFAEDVSARLRKVKAEVLMESSRRVRRALEALQESRKRMDGCEPEYAEALARPFAYGLARTYIGALLLEFASWMASDGVPASDPHQLRACAVAQRWCRETLVALPEADPAHRRASAAILQEKP